ncbi:MAG: hypothetical protein LQ352_006828 [Teloschistes flavicans]|nr:MAG: hypothetical protein LQ352_006828 [Teloschistes flavicans]
MIGFLGPSHEDEKALRLMRHIHEHRENFSEHPQSLIICNPRSFQRQDVFLEPDSESDTETLEERLTRNAQLNGKDGYEYVEFRLSLQTIIFGQRTLGYTFGKGLKKLQSDRRGVDLCIGSAGQNRHNVASIHGCIFLHPRSGALMVGGNSLKNPLIVDEGAKRAHLYGNDSYVISTPETQLEIGELKFVLRTLVHEGQEYQRFISTRNELFALVGLQCPDPRLESLPRSQPWHKKGPALIHAGIGGGTFGWVEIGVHHRTGEPLAVKTLGVGVTVFMKQILNEVEVSLSFPDAPGLLQAQEVRCYHGCSIDAAKLRLQGRPDFCCHTKVNVWMIYPLAVSDFAKHDWSKDSLPFKVQMIREFLGGLLPLHEAGWIHRDLSPQNVLFMSEKPPKAVVADYGKAVRAQTAHSNNIGPLYIQAPEVDGTTEYTNRIDVWSAGLIICLMLIPVHFQTYTRHATGRNPDLGPELLNQLRLYAKKGVREAFIADSVQDMISPDPDDRPEVARVLDSLKKWKDEDSEWVLTSSHSDGPVTKIAKNSNNPTSKDDVYWPGLPVVGDFELNSEDDEFLRELRENEEFDERKVSDMDTNDDVTAKDADDSASKSEIHRHLTHKDRGTSNGTEEDDCGRKNDSGRRTEKAQTHTKDAVGVPERESKRDCGAKSHGKHADENAAAKVAGGAPNVTSDDSLNVLKDTPPNSRSAGDSRPLEDSSRHEAQGVEGGKKRKSCGD